MASALHQPLLLHINGVDVPSASRNTFTVPDALTGKPLYECAAATIQDYDTAIQSAYSAYKSWSRTAPSIRRNILLRAADILTTYLDEIAPPILSGEVSAVPTWIKQNILGSAATLRESASLATNIKGEIVPSERPQTTILITREPVGVIFAVAPWNAPVSLTARAVATPLICGNTIVLKPSENSPKSQHLMVRALIEAGLPPGCLNFLPSSTADAPAVSEFAVKHKLVHKISFTGSDRVGRIIAVWAASICKPTVLEMGGKAPVIVLEDADLDDAVSAILYGALLNSGQICMSTERVIIHENVADKFNEVFLKELRKVKIGNHYEDPTVSLSGLYSPAAPKRILSMINDAIAEGATLLHGDLSISGPNGTILQPHIVDHVQPSMALFQDESFGPLFCITRVPSTEAAIAVANDSGYSLCSSVFTRDLHTGIEVAKEVRAGACHINGPTVYMEATLPNGGVGGRSGYGRFGGLAGVEEFTERKIITLGKPGTRYPL